MLRKRARRLPDFDYAAPLRYSLTFCARERRPLFANADLARCICTQVLQSADVTGYAVIVYCVMPDHVHVLAAAMGCVPPLPIFTKRFKQMAGFHGKRILGASVWQDGYFDHVLREGEDTRDVARYIVMNPVRVGLVASPADYEFTGSGVFNRVDLFAYIDGCRPDLQVGRRRATPGVDAY